jgi:hypothetical protein
MLQGTQGLDLAFVVDMRRYGHDIMFFRKELSDRFAGGILLHLQILSNIHRWA